MSRSAASSDPYETEPKLTPKERYQKILRVVEYNTGGPDDPVPAGASTSTVQQIACQYDYYDGEALKRSRAAAIKAEDLLIWRGRDSRLRLTRTDEESLKGLIAAENCRDDTCVELIERCRELLDDSTADGGDLGVQ